MIGSVERSRASLSLCDGVWCLQATGDWIVIQPAGADMELEDLAQTIASLCITHMTPGTQVTLRLGGGLLVLTMDTEGVRVGWKRHGGNPLVLSTMLNKAVLESRARGANRGASDDSSRSPAPVAAPRRERPPGSVVGLDEETATQDEAVDTLVEYSQRDVRGIAGFAREPISATVLDLTRGPRKVASVSLGDDASEGLSFEIEYDEDPEEIEEPFIAAYTTPSSISGGRGAERSSVDQVTWSDFARIYDNLRDLAVRQIGPRVVDNYWRMALADRSELRGLVALKAEGGLEFLEITAPVEGIEATWMLAVIDAWLSRCERILPQEAAQWRQIVAAELDTFLIDMKDM
jgi:hypothetical protein